MGSGLVKVPAGVSDWSGGCFWVAWGAAFLVISAAPLWSPEAGPENLPKRMLTGLCVNILLGRFSVPLCGTTNEAARGIVFRARTMLKGKMFLFTFALFRWRIIRTQPAQWEECNGVTWISFAACVSLRSSMAMGAFIYKFM